jgi:hypothetical protein
MTGSLLVVIITPIAALSAMGCWLGMIFRADAHPEWKTRTALEGPELTAAGFIPAQAEPGELAGRQPAPSSGKQAA